MWITAEEYMKDALVAMERASETAASAGAEEAETQYQHQCYCDDHREAAALGLTEVPEKEKVADKGGGEGNGPTKAHAGGAKDDDDDYYHDDESGKDRGTGGSLVGSPMPDATSSRRHAISTRSPPDEETNGEGMEEGPRPREPVEQPSDHENEHELKTVRRGLDGTTAALPGKKGQEEDLEDSTDFTPSPAVETLEIEDLTAEDVLFAEDLQFLTSCDLQGPHAKEEREMLSTLAQRLSETGADGPRFPGGDDDTSLERDQSNSDRCRWHAGQPEPHLPLGSAWPPLSPTCERPQQQGKEGPPHAKERDEAKIQRSRLPRSAECDEKAEKGKRRRPTSRSPLATPPSSRSASAVASAVGDDAKQRGLKDLLGGGKKSAGQEKNSTKPVEATATVRQDATANPAVERGAPAHEEAAGVGVGTGAGGCANLETHEHDGEGTIVGLEAQASEKQRMGPAEEGEKEKKVEAGVTAEDGKKLFLSRAERRAADRERAKERARTARAVRLEQHLRSQKKNSPKRIEGQLLRGTPKAGTPKAGPPTPLAAPQAKPAHPEAKTKTKQWRKPPQGSVIAKQAPGNGGGGGGGRGGREGGGGSGATLDGKTGANGASVDKGCAAGSAPNLHPAAVDTPGRSAANGDTADKPAAGSAASAATRSSAAAVAAEPAVSGAKAAPVPSSGATKSVTSSSDRAPTRASGTANKKPTGTEQVSATAEQVSAPVGQVCAMAEQFSAAVNWFDATFNQAGFNQAGFKQAGFVLYHILDFFFDALKAPESFLQGRTTSTPPTFVDRSNAAATFHKVDDALKSFAEVYSASVSASSSGKTTRAAQRSVDNDRIDAHAAIRKIKDAIIGLANTDTFYTAVSISSSGRTASTPTMSLDDYGHNLDAAMEKVRDTMKSLAETHFAVASASSSGKTVRTSPPPPSSVDENDDCDDCDDYVDNSRDLTPAFWGPSSGDGWTWPAAGALGGEGSDADVGGGDGGRVGGTGARGPKGEKEKVAAVAKPLRRFSWVGRPAIVGGKVEHPWGNWKRWRQPEKWEKTVATALTR